MALHFPLQQQALQPIESGDHRIPSPVGRPAAGPKKVQGTLDEVISPISPGRITHWVHLQWES